ncbi:hypothetical protein E2C01_054569 [Portunus trituberculatus]|uniref:Uncharacterized protein n=1 Tax=Portunus trituberculatus TaxID=210409 RepID=A0A5B7GP14_PORTR|nr:hypothetical protein [Portunus trituberculatus]
MTGHTPRPSPWHEVSPLTPKGPPSYCQCPVHGAQRATHHAPASGMKTPLLLPVSSAWCTACHTPRPSPWHEVSPLTPKGPPSYCQCLVYGVQRALAHGELFSPVSSQARDPYTPSTRLADIDSPAHGDPLPSLRRCKWMIIVKLETAKEMKDLLPVPCLGPQARPDSHLLPSCGAQGRHGPQPIFGRNLSNFF